MNPIHFEISTYLIFIFTIILIATRYSKHRDYWFALIGCSMAFPFEWVADKYFWFLLYDLGFVMMFDRLPLMMPFAFGWFFALPLIICLRLQNKIDAMPLWKRILILYLVFLCWDFLVEYISASKHIYVYYWPKSRMIGGVLPLFVPFFVATGNVLLYFAHKISLKYSTGKAWFQGLSIHILAIYIVFTARELIGWILTIQIMGIRPTW